MRRMVILTVIAIGLIAGGASAQVRVPTVIQRMIPATRDRQHQQPVVAIVGIDSLRADFASKSGSDTVYFINDSVTLSAPARATLAAQAMWLRQHPEVIVRIEGHAMVNDTRDHALALGARRAEEVRGYLVLLGVPAAQLTAISLGKERPVGLNARAVTVLVR
jgi:peptidoglycan-associated lipoprotein